MWRMPCVSVEIWGRLYGVTVKVALHGGLPQGQAAICSYLLACLAAIVGLLLLGCGLFGCGLHGGDVHEHVIAAIVGTDETEALLGVEEFHGASRHTANLSLDRD